MTATDPALVLVGGGSMLRADADGTVDVSGPDPARGLFISDVRALSILRLRVDGADLHAAGSVESRSCRSVALVPATVRNAPATFVCALVQRVDADGLHEELRLRETSGKARTVMVTLEAGTDFADPFALRSDRRTYDRSDGRSLIRLTPTGATFSWERRGFHAAFALETDPVAEHTDITSPDGTTAVLAHDDNTVRAERDDRASSGESGPVTVHLRIRIHLPANGTATVRIRVVADRAGDAPIGPVAPPVAAVGLRARALDDLESLRMPAPCAEGERVVAAGVPWFLTLFGRDSLLTAMLTAEEIPDLPAPVLRALAATQATSAQADHASEPGKIAHELRIDELATLGDVPYGRYYGSVDATPLFLMALGRCAGTDLANELESSARASVTWMRGPGGLDATGFLRYRPDPGGLLHQGWKDSHDAIAHADGRIARGSIALCEAQGYAWRALVDTARLARTVWRDDEWGDELDDVAASLQARFRDRFTSAVHGVPVLALDDDEQVDVVASNMGHLLFTGMLNWNEARTVTNRLLAPDMFSGWGLRTLSTHAARYSPMSYHNGAVWPHDTAIAAVGMVGYGFDRQARALADALLDAATAFGGTLPELFSGLERGFFPAPVAYSHAARPQAWACAAVLAAHRIAEHAATNAC